MHDWPVFHRDGGLGRWWPIAQSAVWPHGVVVGDPFGDQIARVGDVAKQRLIQELVPHSTIEAFHEAVLHWLSRRDVMPFDLLLGAPSQDRVQGQLRAIARREQVLPTGYGHLRRKAYTAIAAKMARTVHAVVKHGAPYRPFFEGVSPGGRTLV